jgi:hypothetical protein
MRHKIYNQKVGLEQLLQTVLSQMVQINKMTEIEIKSYVNDQVSKIPSEDNFTNFLTYGWKVEVGDLKQFEKDLERYSISVI